MTLNDQELERYARHIVLPQVGGVGQNKLKAARVAIIGAGGIGSAVIPALAGAGIGRLTIVDDDVVELANLHRQPLFREEDAGQPKAELAAQFVRRLNHFVVAHPIQQRIDADNAHGLLGGHDLVIDGSDNFATRLAVSDACARLGIPLVSAAAVQFQGQVGLFRARALLSLLRRRCVRRRGLRQLRRARCAWRAACNRGQLRRAARAQFHSRHRRRPRR